MDFSFIYLDNIVDAWLLLAKELDEFLLIFRLALQVWQKENIFLTGENFFFNSVCK